MQAGDLLGMNWWCAQQKRAQATGLHTKASGNDSPWRAVSRDSPKQKPPTASAARGNSVQRADADNANSPRPTAQAERAKPRPG
ncbi:MAG: hypothetical protein ACK56F_25165, partial [bacterium]